MVEFGLYQIFCLGSDLMNGGYRASETASKPYQKTIREIFHA